MRAAESEARAHRRLNEVFVTLARRKQSLPQRLLRMLENMQRTTEDPDELERLFELDALATRMRRHAEGLVILSGRPSGRTWRHPVPMVDVARAAAVAPPVTPEFSVAELASHLRLPVGVVRVLVSDLLDRGLMNVQSQGVRPGRPDVRIPKEVIDGLRAL